MRVLASTYSHLLCAAAATALAGCSSTPVDKIYRDETFRTDAPFSTRINGSGDSVCWSVKRAILSQGYMLERSNDTAILTGTRDYQTNEETNVTLRLQATCADNHDGSSIVFATATQETSRLQSMKQSTTAGIGPAMITMPSGSAKVLGIVDRRTITDTNFYKRFFSLVQSFSREDGSSH